MKRVEEPHNLPTNFRPEDAEPRIPGLDESWKHVASYEGEAGRALDAVVHEYEVKGHTVYAVPLGPEGRPVRTVRKDDRKIPSPRAAYEHVVRGLPSP